MQGEECRVHVPVSNGLPVLVCRYVEIGLITQIRKSLGPTQCFCQKHFEEIE
jgi:hypothetical protein